MILDTFKAFFDLLSKLGISSGDLLSFAPMFVMCGLMLKWDKRLTVKASIDESKFKEIDKRDDKQDVRLDDHEKRIGANEIHLKDIFDKFEKGHKNG